MTDQGSRHLHIARDEGDVRRWEDSRRGAPSGKIGGALALPATDALPPLAATPLRMLRTSQSPAPAVHGIAANSPVAAHTLGVKLFGTESTTATLSTGEDCDLWIDVDRRDR